MFAYSSVVVIEVVLIPVVFAVTGVVVSVVVVKVFSAVVVIIVAVLDIVWLLLL